MKKLIVLALLIVGTTIIAQERNRKQPRNQMEQFTPQQKNQFEGKVTDWKLVPKPAINQDYVTKRKTALQLLMRQNARIVRNDADLIQAKEKLTLWKTEIEEKINKYQINADLCELQNLITIGTLIVLQSIDRNENRGGFVKINATNI